MKENWGQIKEIFAGILSLKPEERPAFINLHCNGNERLQSEVESLLSSYDSAGLFLESPAVGEVADTFANECRELKAGEILDHYLILRKIGKGGMGDVYLAMDTKLERKVAVKILNDNFDTGQSNLKRFFQEAKAASGLNHPNIIVVYEIGEFDDNHYIAIEFVKGDTLSEVIKRKDFSLVQIIDISIQVAGALAAAHEVGIVHRDIKPDNIMLRDDGIIKVLDFGLAKLTEKEKAQVDLEAQTREILTTQAGMILGTAAYMSPEQTRGKGIDARTDIWSFGVVLFQMLTRKLPFDGETTSDIIAAILKTETPDLRDFVSDIPAALERIVRKTLQKNPNARYQTANELLADLKHFRRDLEFGEKNEPINARTDEDFKEERITDAKFADVTDNQAEINSGKFTSFISQAVSSARARPNFLMLSLVSLAALMIVGYFGFLKLSSSVSPKDSFQNMKLTKLTYEGFAEDWVSVSPDGKYIVYVVKDKGKQSLAVRQVANSGVVQIVPPADVEYKGLTFTPDGNNILYTVDEHAGSPSLYEIPVLGGNSRKLIENVSEAAAFSPDGNSIAFVRGVKSLMIADNKGGAAQLIATSAPNEIWNSLAWNPDGKSIISNVYSSVDDKFYLVEVSLKDGQQKRLAAPPWIRINGLAFLSDGSGLILSGREPNAKLSQIWFVSYPDGKPIRITNDLSNYVDMSLTAGSKSLVAIKEERQSNIWDSTKSEAPQKITFGEGSDEGLSGVSITPEGKIVYTVRKVDAIDLWIVNVDGSDNRQLTFDQGSNFTPVVSPDGRYIVFISDRTGNADIWRMDIDGGNPAALTNSPEIETYPGFTPDGKWIIYQQTDANRRRTIQKLSINGGNPVQLTDSGSSRPSVSPDGKMFACVYEKPGESSKLAVFPIDGGNVLKIFDFPDVINSRNFKWASDGKAFIYYEDRNRATNLWSQSLDNNPPKQLTFFESGQIFQFDVARNGNGFAVARGNESSDVVMISNFR